MKKIIYKNLEELSKQLNEVYENAPKNEQVAHIHLFGIKYGPAISEMNIRVTEIIRASNLHPSYSAELSKGIKLSKYVKIK